jgi:hypothetical protein
MATTFLPPQNLTKASPVPTFTQPTTAHPVKNSFTFLPPTPLPQTAFGATTVTSYSG